MSDTTCITPRPQPPASPAAAESPPLRRCTQCGRTPRETRFYRERRSPDGIAAVCRDCKTAKGRALTAVRSSDALQSRLRRLVRAESPERLLSLAAAIGRSVGGYLRFEQDVSAYLAELAPHNRASLVASLHAARLRCIAASDELRATHVRERIAAEQRAAELATDEDVIDAAVDVIRRQTRRRRRELVALIDRRRPEAGEYTDGAGI